jgi:hypothetical protein
MLLLAPCFVPAGSASIGLSGAASSATSALDAFMDMSADTLAAAAAAGTGSFRRSASGTAAAAATGGFHRYGLEHPSAADGAAEEVDQEDAGQQQPGSKQVGRVMFLPTPASYSGDVCKSGLFSVGEATCCLCVVGCELCWCPPGSISTGQAQCLLL